MVAKNNKANGSKKKEPRNKFDEAVARHKANGTFEGVVDATVPRRVNIDKAHIAVAKMGDETACVVSQALGDQFLGNFIISTGHSIIKILDNDRGLITRFATDPKLAAALKVFDKTGDWGLEPGSYPLAVPKGTLALAKNQTPEQRAKTQKRFVKFKKRLKAGKTAKTGYGRHVSQPVNSRIITIVR